MKFKSIVLTLLTTATISYSSYCQEDKRKPNSQEMRNYERLLNSQETNKSVLKFCDPGFPKDAFVTGNTNEKAKMEAYAKSHPHVPLLKNTGNVDYDNAKYESDLYEWKQLNYYYPQFIPYHLYNSLLSAGDDILLFETAKKVWIANNADKIAEMNKALK